MKKRKYQSMRSVTKYLYLKWILLLISLSLLVFHIFVIQNILFCFECDSKGGGKLAIIDRQMQSTKSPSVLNSYRRVTKSLSDIRKLTKTNDYILIFNHGLKSGSELFALILKWLQGSNYFKHFHILKTPSGILDSKSQEQVAEFVSKTVQDLATPVSFDYSSYFINFSQYGWESPTYFSVIRDPLDILKVSSKYKNLSIENLNELVEHSSLDLNIPFFCGHHVNCTKMNNDWALDEAKKNVQKYFPMVGILEYTDETLYVLEKKIKYFFKGATDIYERKIKEKHMKWRKKQGNSKGLKEARDILYNEYIFYDWIKLRLFGQLTFYSRQEHQTEKTKNILLNFQIEEP